MKKIYVAHPFNAEEKNKKSVEAIIKSLVERDPTTLYISPIHATGYFYKDVSYEQGMEYCYELLRHCDELLLCRGWEESRGCNLEKAYAENHNIPIRFHWDTPEIEKEEEFRVPTSFGDLVVTRGTKNCPVLVHLDNNGDTYTILRVEDAVKITGEPDLQESRQKAHTELAWLQPWDEWRLRGKTYCSLNLIPIQCVYEPNI